MEAAAATQTRGLSRTSAGQHSLLLGVPLAWDAPFHACAQQMCPGRRHPRVFLQSERGGAGNWGLPGIWTLGARGRGLRRRLGALPPLHTPAGHHIQTSACRPGSRREQAWNTGRRPFSCIRVVFKQNFDLARVSFMEKKLNWGAGKIKCGLGSVHAPAAGGLQTRVH